MNAYVYAAALYCEACGGAICDCLTAEGKAPENQNDETSYDSDDYPKGPFPDGGGEADSPQHCDACGVFLENDLTAEGIEATREMIQRGFDTGRGNREAQDAWFMFYGFTNEDGKVVPP